MGSGFDFWRIDAAWPSVSAVSCHQAAGQPKKSGSNFSSTDDKQEKEPLQSSKNPTKKQPEIPPIKWEFIGKAYQATLSNQGGQLTHLTLTGYSPPVILTGHPSTQESLLALVSRNSQVTLNAASMYEVTHQDKNSVTLRHTTAEDVRITRRYDFSHEQFVLTQTIHIQNASSQARLIALDTVMKDAQGEEKSKKKLV